MKKDTSLTVSGPKVPKAIQDRIMNKIMDKNDDKIVEKLTQIQSHKKAIATLTKEVEELCSVEGLTD